jgi:hypothetical protein
VFWQHKRRQKRSSCARLAYLATQKFLAVRLI